MSCSGALPKSVWGLNCNHKASEHESDLEAIGWYLLINSKPSVCSGSEPVRDIYPIIAWSGHSLLGTFFFKTPMLSVCSLEHLTLTIQLVFSAMSVVIMLSKNYLSPLFNRI